MRNMTNGQQCQWRWQPVVRVRVNGAPATSNVNTLNRSHVIRQVFWERGNVPNREVQTALGMEGLECSNSLISSVRKWMRAAGEII